MSIQRQIRSIDGTLVSLAATLQRPSGTAVDLTNLTVYFEMVSVQGTVKVAETVSNVSVTDATSGQCQYDFQAVDVDTAGNYYAYFITKDGSGDEDRFPATKGDMQVVIQAKS